MDKQSKDDKLKKFLEEEYIKEADIMEEALFSGRKPENTMSEEKVRSSYEELVKRLKADGVYREERDRMSAADIRKDIENTEYIRWKQKSVKAGRHPRYYKMVRAAGFLIVCILGVCLASMTSQASRKYFINTMRYFAGDDTRLIVGNDETNEMSGEDEYDAIADIEGKLHLKVPKFMYRPDDFIFYGYNVDTYSETADMQYQYKDIILFVFVSRNDSKSQSSSSDFHGVKIADVPVKYGDMEISVFEVEAAGDRQPNYVANWESGDVLYYISGKTDRDIFVKMVENLAF
ncbi:MAG: DUF4367 domain-containing protein [Blautia sp.]|nr:DUF4367 domain-containing protein [Blautia sp.]